MPGNRDDYAGWFNVLKFAWARGENFKFGEAADVDALVNIAGGKYASPFYRLRTESASIDRIVLHVIDTGTLEQLIELRDVVVTDYARDGKTDDGTPLIRLTLNATRAMIEGG